MSHDDIRVERADESRYETDEPVRYGVEGGVATLTSTAPSSTTPRTPR